eukprot:ANDGO_06775.mRNA.1 Isochorismatase family protein 1B
MHQALRIGRLSIESTALFVCDVQERFRPLIHNFASVVYVSSQMLQVAKVFGMPVFVTEQNTKALGKTVDELKPHVPENATFEKMKFSMLTDELNVSLQSLPDIKSVILNGIEAHVCVQQTALDLLAEGYDVHLLVDGVSAQRPTDRLVALERLRTAGCYLTTCESAIYELMKTARHEKFKSVLEIVKNKRPEAAL